MVYGVDSKLILKMMMIIVGIVMNSEEILEYSSKYLFQRNILEYWRNILEC